MFVLRNICKDPCNVNVFKIFRKMSIINKKSEVNSIDVQESEESLEDTVRFSEEEITEKRNKSRLRFDHRNFLYNELPYPDPQPYHDPIRFKRRMFGMYGTKSGVDPSILWPTSEDILSSKEYVSLARPNTVQEMIRINTESKIVEKESILQREEEIATKMAKLEKWKEELHARIKKKEDEAAAAKAKKDRLIEEVRRHFGFKVDPRDERFKEMLEKKEKEEKKLAKEAKRKAKEAKMLAQLLEASGKTDVQKPT